MVQIGTYLRDKLSGEFFMVIRLGDPVRYVGYDNRAKGGLIAKSRMSEKFDLVDVSELPTVMPCDLQGAV